MPRKITKVVLTANSVGELGGVSSFLRQTGLHFQKRGYDVLLVGFNQVPNPVDMGDLESVTFFDQPSPVVPSPQAFVLGTRDPRYRKAFHERERVRERAAERARPLLTSLGNDVAVICAQVFAMENWLRAGFDPKNRQGPITFGQHHGSTESARWAKQMGRILRSYKYLDQFVALTAQDAHDFRKAGLPSTTHIPNAVDTEFRTPNTDSKTITVVARLAEVKRLDRLVHAFGELEPRFPDWTVEIWGDGDRKESLESLVAEKGLRHKVRFRGFTSSPSNAFQRAAINVLSSDHEGLPMSVVEASRAQIPTVALRCAPGIDDLIKHMGTGYIAPAKSITGLIRGLETLMSDQELRMRMGEGAQEHSKNFLPDVVIDRWEEEFERALI